MLTDVAFAETNAACNSVWSGQFENKVTPRRGHYQQSDPQTVIFVKDFFLLTALECVPGNCNGLERRMRRIAFFF